MRAKSDRCLLVNQYPRTILAEAYRTLRTNLSFTSPDAPSRILLVTSPGPRDGKSTVAANLSIVLAEAGQKVLLVDCDLRKPAQHTFFNLENRYGLVNLLLGGSGVADYVHQAAKGLDVLTSGPIPPNPSEIISSQNTRGFWHKQRAVYDYVLVDSPPVLSVTDAVLLSTQVEGVIIVLDSTAVESAQETKARLAKVGAKIIGVVLNRGKVKNDAYYYRHQ